MTKVDLQDPNHSRILGVEEISLLVRDHLASADNRCPTNCEPFHQITAQAAFKEAARLGGKGDTEIYERIRDVNLGGKREDIQKELRSIAKDAMSLVLGKKSLDCNGHCDKNSLFSSEAKSHLNKGYDDNKTTKTLDFFKRKKGGNMHDEVVAMGVGALGAELVHAYGYPMLKDMLKTGQADGGTLFARLGQAAIGAALIAAPMMIDDVGKDDALSAGLIVAGASLLSKSVAGFVTDAAKPQVGGAAVPLNLGAYAFPAPAMFANGGSYKRPTVSPVGAPSRF